MCGPILAAVLAGAIFAAVTFLGPGIAAMAIESSLAEAGLRGSDTTVTVTTDPPLELLDGHADRVEIVSSRASIGGLDADRLELTLLDVSLSDGSFSAVQGRMTGVTFRTADGSAITADRVDLAGPADAAVATVRISGATVERLALDAIRNGTGLSIGSVSLAEPDRAVFSVLGIGIGGRFVVAPDGGLAIAVELPGNPQVGLVAAGPMRISSATVVGGDLVLGGTIDVGALLGR